MAAGCGDLGELRGLKTLHLGPNTILVTLAWSFPATWDRGRLEAGARDLVARIKSADARISDVLFEA